MACTDTVNESEQSVTPNFVLSIYKMQVKFMSKEFGIGYVVLVGLGDRGVGWLTVWHARTL